MGISANTFETCLATYTAKREILWGSNAVVSIQKDWAILISWINKQIIVTGVKASGDRVLQLNRLFFVFSRIIRHQRLG